MEVLVSEDNIKRFIVPHSSTGKREGKYKVRKSSIVAAILYKLKAGYQWRQLPTKEFFTHYSLSWQGVYYHFRRWVSDSSLKKVWLELLRACRRLLDLSCVQQDGSQSICKNGGAYISYQSRKA